MIRKAVIAVLTLATVGTAGLGVATHDMPWVWKRDIVPSVGPTARKWVLYSGRIKCQLWQVMRVNPRPRHRKRNWQAAGFVLSDTTYVRVYDLAEFPSAVPAAYFLQYRNSAVVVHRRVGVEVPFWSVLLIFAAYPTIAFIRGPLRRYRRRKRGLCLKCGYNLTGLPEPRCPECGTAFDVAGVREDPTS